MVDWDDDLNQKPIHLAAQNDHTAVVKLFLQVRPSLVTSTVKDGNTLAHLAAKERIHLICLDLVPLLF